MRLFRHYDGLPPDATGAVVAIGNFDGVHRGHRVVIGAAGDIARKAGKPLGVLTFEPHPRRIFQPDAPPFCLSSLRTKAHQMERQGVDCLYVLHFDRPFAHVSAESFVADILVGGLRVSHVVVGEDFVFGHKRGGNVELLRELGRKLGFEVSCVVIQREPDGTVIASRHIRELLAAGQPAQAAKLLGRYWEIEGRVEHGDALGRTLGFPTANLPLGDYQRPKAGIYAVRAGIDEGAQTVWRDGVASLGWRPTFAGQDLRFEAHLFDFSGDLYGKHLRVALIEYLREERKFDGADALIVQMNKDAAEARAVLADPARFAAPEFRLG
ncbi:MAG TPA: bifunctional riboflavin kinase/FAD synthetase [Alphaproteobacteria bacterium]|jgi:riboflavin kinase/FMN adenylyltransferase